MQINLTKNIFFVAGILLSSQSWAAAYDTTVEKLKKITQENPDMVEMFDIGLNDQSQPIYALRIEAEAGLQNGIIRTNQVVVGSHHGNERASVSLAMYFIEDLIGRLKDPTSDRHMQLVDSIYYVIPVLNIGGYNANRREETAANGYNYDPNRDYLDPCQSSSTHKLASTKHLANFIEDNNVIGAVTIHGYIGTFTYPWGTYTTQTSTEDNSFYNTVAKESARANRYRVGTHADVIYPTEGAFEDWAYHATGAWTMLLEMSRNASLPNDSEALLTYFSQMPEQRSINHDHLGNCRSAIGPIRSRP